MHKRRYGVSMISTSDHICDWLTLIETYRVQLRTHVFFNRLANELPDIRVRREDIDKHKAHPVRLLSSVLLLQKICRTHISPLVAGFFVYASHCQPA